jgi:predicted O-linked N-acetylglucosamine transferase (SPINDLY family)
MRRSALKPNRFFIIHTFAYLCIRYGITTTNGLSNTQTCQKEILVLNQIRNLHLKEPTIYEESLRQTSFMLAFCFHRNNDVLRANRLYLETRSIFPEFSFPLVNLALLQMEQNPLKAIELLETYFSEVGGMYGNETDIVDRQARLHGPACCIQSKYAFDCVTALNYYGNAKWKLYSYYEAEDAYRRAIDIGTMDISVLSDVYINLGELMLVMNEPEQADIAFRNASLHEKCHNQNDSSTEFRRALAVSTIVESIENATMMEHKVMSRIEGISKELQNNSIDVSRIQSVHFYFHYYGFNDCKVHNRISKLVADKYREREFEVSNLLSVNAARQKKRIVFISCLLHGSEPHGQLILNVLKYLPRSVFETVLVSLTSKPLSTDMIEAVDSHHHISQKLPVARQFLISLGADCLVFVESLNTGVMYFLAHERFAPVQIMLMGAPVTSGIQDSIDYFFSADRLEHPFRTQISGDNEKSNPYTEQVVLFDGQGISFPKLQYHTVDQSSKIAAGEAVSTMPALELYDQRYQYGEFGLPIVNGSLYFCFQSLFKIQPAFDIVLVRILFSDTKGHVILQAAREFSKTKKVANRILSTVKNEYCTSSEELCKVAKDILTRIHFIPRVTSYSIERLLKHATVVLQPFPFDGSKTATDALSAGVPVVTLPQRFLKGRLTTTFLLSMFLHDIYEDSSVYTCCIASSIDDYVTKVLRLGTDEEYRNRLSTAILLRKDMIYNHDEIGKEWTRFLIRALGIPLTQELLGQIQLNHLTNKINDEIMIEHQAWWRRKRLYQIMTTH